MGTADPLVGRSLEGYKVLDRIKDGSVGSIYLAGRDGKLFALKMLFEKHMANSDKRAKFKREASIASSLEHSCVIRAYGYFEGPPRPFFVMEHFPSENLRQVLQAGLKGLSRRNMILRQMAEGLAHCHSRGVVHLDIKPENALVDNDFNLKVIDFSLAVTKMDRWLSFLGRKVAGTANYMAPEQILNKKLDHRADLYAFGVTAYEILAGRLPFSGRSPEEVFEKHLRAAPQPPQQLNPRITPEISSLILSLLAKDPDKRPPNLEQAIYLFGKNERMKTQRISPLR